MKPITLTPAQLDAALGLRGPSHRHCADRGEGGTSVYTLYDIAGNAQDVVVCHVHGESMPLVDGDRVKARPGDAELLCEFACRLCP